MRLGLFGLMLGVVVGCGEEAPPPAGDGDAQDESKAEAKTPAGDAGAAKSEPTAAEKAKAEGPPPPTPLPEGANPALTDPALAQETAPARYKCEFKTSKGTFVVDVHRDWAPNGADRFYNLCKIGYFDNARFFRNIEGFMVQFGMSAYPAATKVWQEATIDDDPVVQSNKPLYVTFAKTNAPNSRSTQIFINHGDNSQSLDGMGFAPFGTVAAGQEVIGQLFTGYGEGAPRGRGPNQAILAQFGEVYLEQAFPMLDRIEKVGLLE